MTDWVAHYDAIYDALGVPATLTLTDTDGTSAELTVIDKTVGVEVGFNDVGVATIAPAADVRMSELAEKSLLAALFEGAALTMNGKDWTVESHEYRPAPTGEAGGELRLVLVKAA